MTDNVVKFPGMTLNSLVPSSILKSIAEQNPEEVVVITMSKNELNLHGSMADLQRVLWLLKKTEYDILSGRY